MKLAITHRAHAAHWLRAQSSAAVAGLRNTRELHTTSLDEAVRHQRQSAEMQSERHRLQSGIVRHRACPMTTDYEVVTYADDSKTEELRCFQLSKPGGSEAIVNRRVLFVQLVMVNTVVGRVHKRERRTQISPHRTG